MSSFTTEPTQNFEYMAVVVDDVDTSERLIHARDRTGAVVQISYRDQPGGVSLVPKQGEKWIAIRKGYTWFLDKRLDSPDEGDELAGYLPGDMRIRADGAIRIVGDSLTFNGSPLGATVTDEFEHPTTGYSSVALSAQAASEDAIEVFLNGLLLSASLWAWSAATNVVTFTPAVGEAGFLAVVYRPVG